LRTLTTKAVSPSPVLEQTVSSLTIRVFGDPVLRQKAREVTDFDGRLAALAQAMHDTMRAADGVGLAANQVGVLKRLFTFEAPNDSGDMLRGSIVNPVLVSRSTDEQDGEEGCLSLPQLFYPVVRPQQVVVEYQQLDGAPDTLELSGFLARVWLHEMDHLDGVLFIDHLAQHDRQAALKILRERALATDTDPQAATATLLPPRA